MTTTSPASPPRASFLDLPGEIRNEIYRMLLTTRYAWSGFRYQPLHTAILRVNHVVHREAVSVLQHSNVWIVAAINLRRWPFIAALPAATEDTDCYNFSSERPTPYVSRKNPSCIKNPALYIRFECKGTCSTSEGYVTTIIFGEESMSMFIRSVWSISEIRSAGYRNSSLRLELGSLPFHSRTYLQSTCLEPFELVRDLRSIIIKGDVEPAYRENLLRRMRSPFTSLDSVFRQITDSYLGESSEDHLRDVSAVHERYLHGRSYLLHAYYSLQCYKYPDMVDRGYRLQSPCLKEVSDRVDVLESMLEAYHLRSMLQVAMSRQFKLVNEDFLFDTIKRDGASLVRRKVLPAFERWIVHLCKLHVHLRFNDDAGVRETLKAAVALRNGEHPFGQTFMEIFPRSVPFPEKLQVIAIYRSTLANSEDGRLARAFQVAKEREWWEKEHAESQQGGHSMNAAPVL